MAGAGRAGVEGRVEPTFANDFMYDATDEDEETGASRSPLFIVLTVLVLLAFVAVVWVAYQQGLRQGDAGSPPLIAADPGPIRSKPDEPGGTVVPDQDKLIFEAGAAASSSQDEALAAPPELPRDLPPPADSAAVPVPKPSETAIVTEEPVAEDPMEIAPAPAPAKPKSQDVRSELAEVDPGIKAAEAKEVDVGSGAAVVQIGAYANDAEAAAAWQMVKTKYADIVKGLKPDIRRADLGQKGVWYRLRMGPFETRAAANKVCQAIEAKGGSCLVGKP
jgi:cell division protein FtsN